MSYVYFPLSHVNMENRNRTYSQLKFLAFSDDIFYLVAILSNVMYALQGKINRNSDKVKWNKLLKESLEYTYKNKIWNKPLNSRDFKTMSNLTSM